MVPRYGLGEAMRGDVTDYARARVGKSITSKYRLERLIGCGGMAAVYEAVHRNGHRVAIKMLHPHVSMESDLRTRFLREGYVANKVNHRGAVRVADDDVADDGSVFLVMELLEGETLDARWERHGRRLPLPEVCELAGQLLDVLAAAHAQRVVHRDIKPENLFLTSEGVLKVLDFGIARLQEASGAEGATRTGRMMGTPAFMPPEQALGRSRQIDGQTDLWAAGATMFTLASGQFVHEAETMEEMLVHAASRPARSIGALLPGIPLEVARVVERALAFKKEERWLDAAAMHLALVQAYAAAFGAPLPGPRPRTKVDVDPYAATAASTGGVGPSVHTPMPSAPSPAPADRSASGDRSARAAGIPPTVPWVPPPRVGPGVSTTAGMAQSAEVVDGAPGLPRGRSRAPKLLGVVAAAMLLAAGGALVAMRANSVERPAAIPAAIGATSAPTEPGLGSASVPRAAEQALASALAPVPVASDLAAARRVGEQESASSPAASGRPPSVAPGHARARQSSQAAMVASPAVASGGATQAGTPGAGTPAGSPGASLPVAFGAALPPVDVGAAAPPAGSPEATAIASAPAATAERVSPPAPTKPACRAVPYFDSDGSKRFRQECR
jgi:eukaryotic-like serine/threonine-protein kinase